MPRKQPHDLGGVLSLALEPWAITKPMLEVIATVLGARIAGQTPLAFEINPIARRGDDAEDEFGHRVPEGVAVVPLRGVIAPRMNMLSHISGGTSFEQATSDLNVALDDPRVRTIVLDVDSPGGSANGASEFARTVLAARARKPVIAHANYKMTSAAYWVAACATEVVAAPSAMLGGIGVYTIHDDLSAALEKAGVKRTVIAAGKYKAEGVGGGALTEEGTGRVKGLVESHYARFTTDVAHGRRVTPEAVRDGFGEGAVVDADNALALGMIDRIATFDETLARFAAPTLPAPLPAARATTPASPDTPHEPAKATGHDRSRARLDLQRAILALEL